MHVPLLPLIFIFTQIARAIVLTCFPHVADTQPRDSSVERLRPVRSGALGQLERLTFCFVARRPRGFYHAHYVSGCVRRSDINEIVNCASNARISQRQINVTVERQKPWSTMPRS
jgi:hypothetical protein